MSERFFLTADPCARRAYHQALTTATDTLLAALPTGPYSGATPAELADYFANIDLLPTAGQPLPTVLHEVGAIIADSVNVTHPHVSAHLHCPPLIPALAAEVILSALNQSMDSFDQAPAATALEQALTKWLCECAGLPTGAAGVFTAGGTQSNYQALWLARDAAIRRHFGRHAQTTGLPAEARRLRFLCAETAHFSVEKSAAQLGLGTDAVVRVGVDAQFRMRPDDLAQQLRSLRTQGLLPAAVVATAGSTDFGAIDPLAAVADLARAAGAWYHIDAAYGGALLVSPRHANLLAGVELADSVTVDFHKLLWQPISCGALLVRSAEWFDLVKTHADYLNPAEHEELGIPDLVGRSVLTTRRFDALKVFVTLRTLGAERLGQLFDQKLALSGLAARLLTADGRFELLHSPELGCLVFRYRSGDAAADERINAEVPRRLFRTGRAVIGHTRWGGRACLKLTFLNPEVTEAHLLALIELIGNEGDAVAAAQREPALTAW